MAEHDTDRRPQISTFLWITGDLDPAAWTMQIGLSPLETGLKGEQPPGKRLPIPRSFWGIGFTQERGDSIDAGFRKLLDRSLPRSGNLASRYFEEMITARGSHRIADRLERQIHELRGNDR